MAKFYLVKAMVFLVVMYGCESYTIKKLSSEELMLLNCGDGEDSWESLGLQGDPTSQSARKSNPNIHWKDWCWSWSSNTLAIWCKELTHWKRKDPDAGKDWRQEEGMTEDRMVRWHHWLKGWFWAGSGRWWRTGKPVVLQSMRSQRVGQDWMTEQQLSCVQSASALKMKLRSLNY